VQIKLPHLLSWAVSTCCSGLAACFSNPPVTPSFGFGGISWSGEYRHAVKVSSEEESTA
jgi:hypothetical protein